MAERIGRYEIKRELGRGGMATVYLAFDPRFRRQVAVKVLPRQFTHDPKYLARFEQEAQTIATLEHPAIVPVYDFGEHEDAPYLVMRYMAGGNLRARLSGDPLPLKEIASALDRLAPALDHAHELGIIHRDLKPANILFDYEGRPYSADFGIARLAEASHTMTIVGTPAYMSPEQAESKVKLDGRSDLYALGVMLYELLSGAQPYTAETPTGQMLMHVLEPVPDILQANPDLPPQAQKVIEKGMAKDREERYQSAGELATAVNGLLASQATAASTAATAPVITAVAVEDRLTEPDAEAVALSSEDALVEMPDEAAVSPEAESERAASEQEVAPLETEPDHAAVEPISDSVRSVSDPGVKAPPSESAATWRDLPIWVWGLAALALLVIGALGIRFVMLGGAVDDAAMEPAAEAPAEEAKEAMPAVQDAVVEEEVPTGEEIMGEEGITADADMLPPGAAAGDTWVRPADEMAMVYVPAGSFAMGSEEGATDEAPLHEVALDAFWIDRTEVTNSQYRRCVSAGSCEPSSYADDDTFSGDDYPVVGVSWYDAEAYCKWADGSLPSEAQWEVAARGPEGLTFPWGNEFDGQKANFCDVNCPYDHAQGDADDGFAFTAPVGSYTASAGWAGELDMAGNVWEWVNDWYDPDYYAGSSARNPQGPDDGEGKVLRGGSWGSAMDSLRSATRDVAPPDFRDDYAGFRCTGATSSAGEGKTGAEEVAETPAQEAPAEDEITADAAMPPLEAELGEKWLRPSDEMTMVFVPEGSFPMGSEGGNDNESPLREVSLDAFWIDSTEVTNGQYALCVNDGSCEPSEYAGDSDYNGENYPVVGVSWYDAEAYCAWAEARLPTEAEWEYAARGPEGLDYPWGDEEPDCDLAQFGGCYGDTIPVGSLPNGASWTGALDMAGNVWEWVNDWYDSEYYANSPARNPQGPQSGDIKVLRGGSWSNNKIYLRGANRDSPVPDDRNVDIRFRCDVSPGN